MIFLLFYLRPIMEESDVALAAILAIVAALDAMVATLRDHGTKTFVQFHASLVNFFRVKLKMQE